MELTLQEKEVDIQEKRNNAELEKRRGEITLLKKQIEIDAYKNIAEDATSILDVVDFNRAHDAYQQLAVAGNSKSTGGPPAKKTPGGQHLGFRESALPAQHAMKPKLEETCIQLPALRHRPDSRNIDSTGPETGFSHFRPEDPIRKHTCDRGQGHTNSRQRVEHEMGHEVIPLSLERALLEETTGGLRYSGNDTSEYPAYRHRFLLRHSQLRKTRPDLLLKWIETTVTGQARRYIRNAFSVFDAGRACDIVWDTLEEVYGRKEVILEDAMRQIKRPAKSVDHNRKALLELRADMRNVQGIADSLNMGTALQKPHLMGTLYSSLSDKLRDKLESFLPPDQWTYGNFILFLTREIAYIDTLHTMKIEEVGKPGTLRQPKPSWSANTRQVNCSTPHVATNERSDDTCYVQRGVKEKCVKECLLHPEVNTHSLVECRKFLGMKVSERWVFIKERGLCFSCLGKNHRTRNCKESHTCDKCGRNHHDLLHDDDLQQKSNVKPAATNKPAIRDMTRHENTGDHTDTVGMVRHQEEVPEQIGLMLLTAIKRDHTGYVCGRIPFYAAIDTGATRTLCSRELGEQLHGGWLPDSSQHYKMFNGALISCEVMRKDLEIEETNQSAFMLNDTHFIDQKLPFSRYLEEGKDSTLPRRIDMILGSDLAWKHLFFPLFKCLPLSVMPIGLHNALDITLGRFWLSAKTHSHNGTNQVAAAIQPAMLAERGQEQWKVSADGACTISTCPSGTDPNPADVATRGCRLNNKEKWDLWTGGPCFLCCPASINQVDLSTIKKTCTTEVMSATQSKPPNCAETGFMEHTLSKTNKMQRAFRILNRVIKCYYRWKGRLQGTDPQENNAKQKELVDNPKNTLRILVRAAQHDGLGELIALMQHENISFEDALYRLPEKRTTSMTSMRGLVPYVDCDGILRVGGRLDYSADLSDEAKHPALLPIEHNVTRLLILERHEKLAHRSAEWVLASLNSDMGVRPIGGIRTVRTYLNSCFTCKLLRKSRAEQLMSPLPNYRVTSQQPVFSSVSIDYTGPFEVKRGRNKEKRWICMFVCNATSAVRIEMVESLSTTSFLNCLQRFLCLTANKTQHIRSDCATTFIGANNILNPESAQTTWESMKLRDSLSSTAITWEFSTPASSHHQGTVERQIRTFKEVCEGILGADNQARLPSDFELMTICRQAEYIMNCRPMGKFVGNQDDVKALRPIDLITGYLDPSDSDLLPNETTNIRDKLRRGHQYTRRLAQEWWQRWTNRYLYSLQERQKWRNVERNFQKGDLVLLIDPATPPVGRHPYALVVDLKQCPDGKVRSATVRMSDGRIREQDVRKLVLIEPVTESRTDNNCYTDDDVNNNDDFNTSR